MYCILKHSIGFLVVKSLGKHLDWNFKTYIAYLAKLLKMVLEGNGKGGWWGLGRVQIKWDSGFRSSQLPSFLSIPETSIHPLEWLGGQDLRFGFQQVSKSHSVYIALPPWRTIPCTVMPRTMSTRGQCSQLLWECVTLQINIKCTHSNVNSEYSFSYFHSRDGYHLHMDNSIIEL